MMPIGQVIRKYRKMKNLTQEEMANRLGVTAPAVNKWENGNSLPDIMLLAPISRLLGISLDTLLSFREELTREEITDIIYQVNTLLREKPFEEAFRWAKKKLEQYPDCELLILEVAVMLHAEWKKHGSGGEGDRNPDIRDSDDRGYEELIHQWFARALESSDEQVRTIAASCLFDSYLDKGEYDKAEECLAFFSGQNPERKRKQAVLCCKTGRRDEAYKIYEELLFSMFQTVNLLFHSIYRMALQDKDMDKVQMLTEKRSKLANIFGMGEYYEVLPRHELAVAQKDVETTISTMQKMLASLSEIDSFNKSPLYGHMDFKKMREEFREQLREDILNAFRDEEVLGFLKGDSRWEDMVGSPNR